MEYVETASSDGTFTISLPPLRKINSLSSSWAAPGTNVDSGPESIVTLLAIGSGPTPKAYNIPFSSSTYTL